MQYKMNVIIKKTAKALNVIKYLMLFLIFLIFTNCNVLKGDYYKTETYEIIREKRNFNNPKIIIKCYDYNDNSNIPASILLNEVFLDNFPSNQIITELRSGKINLTIYFIGKETVKIKNLLVRDRDSIVVKAYMKEDLTPLY